MSITIEKIESLNPCKEGFSWYVNNINTENLQDVLIQLNGYRSDWARWLFTRLMTKEQKVQIAVYSAELVLPIFENKYPNDLRPRKAIEAAKEYLKTKTNTDTARTATYAAAYAAYAAADTSAARAAACATYAARAAAYAAADTSADISTDISTDTSAARTAACATYAADTAADTAADHAAARKEIQEKIIFEATGILRSKL